MTVPCPRCTNGTYESCGRFYRCHFCGGTGRVVVPESNTSTKEK